MGTALMILRMMANFSEIAVIYVRSLPPEDQAREAAEMVVVIKELRAARLQAKDHLGEFADDVKAKIEVIKTKIGGSNVPTA